MEKGRKISTLLLIVAGLISVPQSVTAEMSEDFDLSLDSLMSVEVSSSAKYSQRARDAAATVTVITAEEIRRYGYRTLEDALANVRGFYISNDRTYSYLGARGFSRPTDYNNRILLLLNGHSLNENVYGSALIGTELGWSLDNVARIEIVRGPGSVVYGSNAMFAVINVVSEDGNTVDGVSVSAEGGDQGRVSTSVEFGLRTKDEIDLSGLATWYDKQGTTLYFPEYDDFATNHGVSATRDWDRSEGGVFSASRRGLKIHGMAARREKSVPTGAYDTDFTSDNSKTTEERAFVEAAYQTQVLPSLQASARAYYDRYVYSGVWPYDQLEYDRGRGNWVGAEGLVRWDVSASNRLIAGSEYQSHLDADYRYWSDDSVYFFQNFPATAAAAFVQDEWQIGTRVALTTGIRADYNSTSRTTLTPRTGLLFFPSDDGVLKILYGEAFRIANVFERELGDGSGSVSPSDLEPERIRTYEVAWENRLSRNLWAAVSVFHYSLRDLISEVESPDGEGWVFMNSGRANANGLECELDWRDLAILDGDISYTLQETADSETGEVLTNSPRHLLKLGVSAAITGFARLSMRQTFESSRRTVYDTETDGFALTSLTLLVRPGGHEVLGASSFLHRLDVRMTVYNVFDTPYQVPGGFEHRQPGIPQDGRNVMVRVSLRL